MSDPSPLAAAADRRRRSKRRRWFGRKPRAVKVNTSLRLLHEVLGMDHLHYGLWDGEPLTRAGLEAAQERYAETLCDWVPEGVETILDVGCGTGSTALKLRDRGYRVEGLAPDPYLRDIFTERTGLPFHMTRFEDFEPARTYDLVLMSESAQYIWPPKIFPNVARVAPRGYYLVADYFVLERDGGHATKSGHPLDAFLAEAVRRGFELQRREDVTERAAPTLELAAHWQERYVLGAWRILADSAANRRPWLFALARRLFGPALGRRVEHAAELWNAEAFRRLKRYELMLFRAAAGPSEPETR